MKPDTAQLDSITLDQMRELWPKSEEGALCARLLQRYTFSMLIASTIGAECSAERAQAEAGAAKALAKIVTDFGTLMTQPAERAPRKPMAALHRFQPQQPETPEKS